MYGVCTDTNAIRNCGSCNNSCPDGLPCVNRRALCPVSRGPSGGLISNSNYYLDSECQNIVGLTVALNVTQDMLSGSGFTIQLNDIVRPEPSRRLAAVRILHKWHLNLRRDQQLAERKHRHRLRRCQSLFHSY